MEKMPKFSPEEIEILIKKTSNSSKEGPDKISYKLMKELLPEIAIKLSEEFNIILDNPNQIDSNFFESATKLIPKKGTNQMHLKNKRPIALNNCTYKIFMKGIQNRIKEHTLKFISPLQSGFVENRSTHRNLSLLLQAINQNKLANKKSHVLYIDIVKAYDSVQHHKLIETLKKYNFDNTFIKIVNRIYGHSFTKVETAYGPSEPIDLMSGIKQGCPLSCLLFIIYINPIIERIRNKFPGIKIGKNSIPILAFVDDLSLLANSKSMLKKMAKFILTDLETLQFKISIDEKSKTVYTTDQKSSKLPLKIKSPSGMEWSIPLLPGNEFYRFLGIWISMTLDWSKVIETDKNIFKWSSSNITDSVITANQGIKVYEACMIPYLSYRTAILDYPEKSLIDLQNVSKYIFTNKLRINKWTSLNSILNAKFLPPKIKKLKDISISSQISLAKNILLNPNESLDFSFLLEKNWTCDKISFALKYSNIKPNHNPTALNILNGVQIFNNFNLPYSRRLNSFVIFTDGTRRTVDNKNKTATAIVGFKENPYILTGLPTIPDNYGAEISGVLIAIKLTKLNHSELSIVCDSKGVIQKLQQLPDYSTSEILKWDYGPLFLECKKLIKEKDFKINFVHIYSHLLDSQNSWKNKKKMEEMEKTFGDELPFFLNGNKAADDLCSNWSDDPSLPQDFSPIKTLYLEKDSIPILSNLQHANILSEIQKISMKIPDDPPLNIDKSAWKKLNKWAEEENLETFLFRVLNNKLFDKNKEFLKNEKEAEIIKSRTNKFKNLKNKKYHDPKYVQRILDSLEARNETLEEKLEKIPEERNNPLCMVCSLPYSGNHFIECPENLSIWEDHIGKIIKGIETRYNLTLPPFPWINLLSIDENANFPLPLIGAIPMEIKIYLKIFAPKNNKLQCLIMKQLSLELLHLARKIYNHSTAINIGRESSISNPNLVPINQRLESREHRTQNRPKRHTKN
jgi:hypothetical protein